MKNNGGYVFPHQEMNTSRGTEPIIRGMTMRDYFAAKAMQGLLTSGKNVYTEPIEPHDSLQNMAYQIADAMLEEKNCE